MVFSSLPLYLDPPNWQQGFSALQHLNQNHQQANGHHENPQLLQQQQQQQPHQQQPSRHLQMANITGGGGGISGVLGGSTGGNSISPPTLIRPNSMAERARMAKIPQPEGPLKCPRCDSTNTKFCYFNNYSLSQPRHFCKTCRRYWTRGGALRNVPVGGCRRNKISKSMSSKSNTSGGGGNTGINSSNHAGTTMPTSGGSTSGSAGPGDLLNGNLSAPPQLSFMASLQNITQLGMGNLGLNFPGVQSLHQLATNSTYNNSHMDHQFGSSDMQQTHHFPFMSNTSGFEIPSAPAGLYNPFQNEGTAYGTASGDQNELMMRSNKKGTAATRSRSPQNGSVKSEENFQKQLLSMSADQRNHQFWGCTTGNGGGGGGGGGNNGNSTNMWTDLSGLNSSSTTHHLV